MVTDYGWWVRTVAKEDKAVEESFERAVDRAAQESAQIMLDRIAGEGEEEDG